MENLLSHKNQVIIKSEGKLYGFNHRKLIAKYDIKNDKLFRVQANIETFENERFFTLFKDFAKRSNYEK